MNHRRALNPYHHATYRGDKLTKRVWEEILQGQYIAQQQVASSKADCYWMVKPRHSKWI
jgi:hypothetical protein